jgi:hypothetical protein
MKKQNWSVVRDTVPNCVQRRHGIATAMLAQNWMRVIRKAFAEQQTRTIFDRIGGGRSG